MIVKRLGLALKVHRWNWGVGRFIKLTNRKSFFLLLICWFSFSFQIARADWEQMDSGADLIELEAIWGTSSSDVIAVGLNTILRYDGVSWQEMSHNLPSVHPGFLDAIWGDSSKNVLTASSIGVYRYNGNSWEQEVCFECADPQGRAIWGSSPDNIWVAARGTNIIFHFNGAGWTNELIPAQIGSLWGDSANDIFGVVTTGTILHYNGKSWNEMNTGINEDLSATETLNSVWGNSGDDVFAVGTNGTIMHYDGNNWGLMNSGTTENLNSVWANSSTNVFAVGENGTILQYNGNFWSKVNLGVFSIDLNCVWGASNGSVFAVGNLGVILRCDGCANVESVSSSANRTAASTPYAETTADPIQTATGEFYTLPLVDINLGGPMSLNFNRRYASGLKAEGLVQSALGSNWIHNFNIGLINIASESLDVVYTGGKIISFKKSDSNWGLTNNEEIVYQLREDSNGDFWFLDPLANLVYHFNGTTGALGSIQDRNGNALSFSYDASKRLAKVMDGLGRSLSLSYSDNGNLALVDDGTRTVSYSYNNNVLAGATNVMGSATTYSYDPSNSETGFLLTSITLPNGNIHNTQTYDSRGRVTGQSDAFNNTLTLQYDAPSSGVTTITDALGNSKQTSHQNRKIMTKREGPTGNSASISYDANDRPISIADRIGEISETAYHIETGKVASIVNVMGEAVSYKYTPQSQTFGEISFIFHNLARVDYPDGTNEQFIYDAKGNVLTEIDRAKNSATNTYNGMGLPLTITNPAGGVIVNTFNVDGTLASTADSDTGTTSFEYDSLKRLIKITLPDSKTIQFSYNPGDLVTSVTDENNNVAQFFYDANGNLTMTTDSNGKSAKFVYDALDRIVKITDKLNSVTEFIFDNMGRLSTFIDPNGLATQIGYDARDFEGGRVNSVIFGRQSHRIGYDDEGIISSNTTPLGNTTNIQTDKLGFISGVTDPLGHTADFTRDNMGKITTVADPLGRVTKIDYDAGGRLSGVAAPDIGASVYSRNDLGRLSRITDLNGKDWTFDYTGMGRLKSISDPLGNTVKHAYDVRGRLSQTTFADASTIARTYDDAGNTTRMLFSDGTDLQYTYDSLNRLLTTNNLTLTRDAEGRTTSTNISGAAFDADYDNGGRLKTAAYNNGAFTVAYAYDGSTGLLSRVTDSLTNTRIDFNYNKDFRLAEITRSNGVNTSYTYDNAARLTGSRDGNIIDMRYTLDAAGQVVQAKRKAPLNPADFISPGERTFTFDASSQISVSGYNYDKRGRLIDSPRISYVWDGASRLIGINNATLEYNGLNDITSRAEGETSINYFYNYAIGFNPIMAEEDGSTDRFIHYYVWTPGGRLLYMIDAEDGNKVYHYHFDRTGSTLALTDSDGTVTDSYAYAPYGKLLEHNGSNKQPFTFVGSLGVRQEGAGGTLYQMRTRYYDVDTSKFISREPIWTRILNPKELNQYQYAVGNPVSNINPLGQTTLLNSLQAEIHAIERGEIEDVKTSVAFENKQRYIEIRQHTGKRDWSAKIWKLLLERQGFLQPAAEHILPVANISGSRGASFSVEHGGGGGGSGASGSSPWPNSFLSVPISNVSVSAANGDLGAAVLPSLINVPSFFTGAGGGGASIGHLMPTLSDISSFTGNSGGRVASGSHHINPTPGSSLILSKFVPALGSSGGGSPGSSGDDFKSAPFVPPPLYSYVEN